MSLYVVITVITAIITAAVGIADFIPAGFVLANSAKVHVPRSWLPMLGTLKLAERTRLGDGQQSQCRIRRAG